MKKSFIVNNAATVGLMLLTASAYAVDWYSVKVTQIIPNTWDGDVIVQFTPGAGETGFIGDAQGLLPGSGAGSNKVMAVLLSSVALNTEVTIKTKNPPSWDSPEVIKAAGLISPN